MEKKLSDKISENLEILEIHINDENNLFKTCNEEEELNFIHTHTNDDFSTKFATNTNVMMNNEIEVQIINNKEDGSQIKISDKATDNISDFVIEIKNEDKKAQKCQDSVTVEHTKPEVSLRDERDLPTQFIDNDEKLNTLINTDNKISNSNNFNEGKNSSIESKEEVELFSKRKFSKLVNKSQLNPTNKLISEINNKHSHKRFKKIHALRKKESITGLINYIDNFKNILKDSLSMKLK